MPERARPIYIVRVPRKPAPEEVRDALATSGAELVGAYKIFGGIPSEIGTDVDGMEFVIQSAQPIIPGGAGRIFRGLDVTDQYAPEAKSHEETHNPLLPEGQG
jgi:hypothetical protein